MAYRQIGGAFFLRNRLDGPQMDTFFWCCPVPSAVDLLVQSARVAALCFWGLALIARPTACQLDPLYVLDRRDYIEIFKFSPRSGPRSPGQSLSLIQRKVKMMEVLLIFNV